KQRSLFGEYEVAFPDQSLAVKQVRSNEDIKVPTRVKVPYIPIGEVRHLSLTKTLHRNFKKI
ncbi:MAG: hypothetical protein ABI988_19045, partial [Nitrospirota bacterium]